MHTTEHDGDYGQQQQREETLIFLLYVTEHNVKNLRNKTTRVTTSQDQCQRCWNKRDISSMFETSGKLELWTVHAGLHVYVHRESVLTLTHWADQIYVKGAVVDMQMQKV